jgi:membrane-bound serine protease (ClpP class)
LLRFDGSSAKLQTAGAAVEVYKLTPRQRIVSAIADPNIALILLVVGALFIYVEFTAPGLIAPGVIGAILVLLGLSAISVLPINWLGAALLILAFVLFLLEAHYTSHGVLAVGGSVAMMLGAVLLINSPIPEMRIRWTTAAAVTLPFSLITALLISLALKARRAKVETGSEGMVGKIGSAVTDLSPKGKVFVHGEYWDAVSLHPVTSGASVRVTGLEGLILMVEPVPNKTGE